MDQTPYFIPRLWPGETTSEYWKRKLAESATKTPPQEKKS